jgi:hypothetical protein
MNTLDKLSQMEIELLNACQSVKLAGKEFARRGATPASRAKAAAQAVVEIDLALTRAARVAAGSARIQRVLTERYEERGDEIAGLLLRRIEGGDTIH